MHFDSLRSLSAGYEMQEDEIRRGFSKFLMSLSATIVADRDIL